MKITTNLHISRRDSISRPIAPVSSVAGGDGTTRPRRQGKIGVFIVPHNCSKNYYVHNYEMSENLEKNFTLLFHEKNFSAETESSRNGHQKIHRADLHGFLSRRICATN
jgi:hypothetical protein